MSSSGKSSTGSESAPAEVSYSRPAPRSGGGSVALFGVILVVVVVAGVGYALNSTLSGGTENAKESGALLYTVAKNDILVTVTEDGNVESASNVEVKCEIANGSKILWIVEDGKIVEKDEKIIELDRAPLDDQVNAQKMTYEKALAADIQARSDLKAAEIAIKEYEEGTFQEELSTVESEIRIAEENLRTAQNVFEYTKKMVRKGFATSLQREADQFAVERAQLDLKAANTRKKVLERFTKEKMLTDLRAKRDTAEAKARSDKVALDMEKTSLERLEKQLDKCILYAPQAGMVVYANDASRSRFGGQTQPQIEEGASVREQQTLVRIPDDKKMQVKVTVHESKVDQLARGSQARIVIQEKSYKGNVISVANQPATASFFSANVKEYPTVVAIDGNAEGLRPGMTAHVEILIADLKDVLTIPVSSVVEHRDEYFCWVTTSDGYEKRALKVGQTNDVLVHVVDGVKEGDKVLRNPRAILEEARLETPLEEDKASDSKEFGEKKKPSELRPERPQQGGGGRPGGSGGGRGSFQIPENGKAYIAKYDKNGDGKVQEDELEGFAKRGFSSMDTNADGDIDEKEADVAMKRFQEMMKNRGGAAGRPGGGRPDSGSDTGGGTPDRESRSSTGGGSGGRSSAFFDRFDKDKDGKLSREETPEFMKARFDVLDADKDGFVTLEEFRNAARPSPDAGGGDGGPTP